MPGDPEEGKEEPLHRLLYAVESPIQLRSNLKLQLRRLRHRCFFIIDGFKGFSALSHLPVDIGKQA